MNPHDSRLDDSPRSREARVVLPEHRGPFAANDFTDLRKRQTDEAVAEYLMHEAKWPVWRGPRRIVLHLPGASADAQLEQTTCTAYRDLLRHCGHRSARKLVSLIPKITLLLVIGLTMIYLSNVIGGAEGKEASSKTAAEVARVGGWVAMWTAVALFFYDGAVTINRVLAFRRLRRLPIEVDYQEVAASPPGRRGALSKNASPS